MAPRTQARHQRNESRRRTAADRPPALSLQIPQVVLAIEALADELKETAASETSDLSAWHKKLDAQYTALWDEMQARNHDYSTPADVLGGLPAHVQECPHLAGDGDLATMALDAVRALRLAGTVKAAVEELRGLLLPSIREVEPGVVDVAQGPWHYRLNNVFVAQLLLPLARGERVTTMDELNRQNLKRVFDAIGAWRGHVRAVRGLYVLSAAARARVTPLNPGTGVCAPR